MDFIISIEEKIFEILETYILEIDKKKGYHAYAIG